MASVQEWNAEMFVQSTASGVAVVDFYAVWCGPCKMMMSVLTEAVSEFSDEELKVGKINIENCRDLAAEFNVRTIPTFIVFKNGEVVSRHIGVQSRNMLVNAVRKALEA